MATTPTTGQATFVIFEIIGGCGCCQPGPRETVLPEGWSERAGRLTLRQVLSRPHGVKVGAVKILAQRASDGLTRDQIEEIRAGVTGR